MGNNQGNQALYYIYDNVIGGPISMNLYNTGSQIYNNLLFLPEDTDPTTSISDWMNAYQLNIWNNITISNGVPTRAYHTDDVFSTGSSTSPITYMDYNVYDSTPGYAFNTYGFGFTLAQMQSYGFENHAYVVPTR